MWRTKYELNFFNVKNMAAVTKCQNIIFHCTMTNIIQINLIDDLPPVATETNKDEKHHKILITEF